jgi:hypothetical protein
MSRVDDGAELPTMISAEVVEVVGLYPVVRLLGQGASSRVFECKDTVSPPPDRGRHVAVKVLRPEFALDDRWRRRLRGEGELLKGLASPWIARCFDVGEHDGATFLVVEFLSGEDLGARLARDGALPLKEALRYARDAAKGLRAAWAAGVVHGDVKPANLFVDGRRLKVVDFGLALPTSSSPEGRSTLAGTPAFLAPEVIAGGRQDARSDLYSLGCTLFALLTGRPPFAHARTADLLVAHAQEPPPSLSRLLPGTPSRVVAVVDALLQKAPSLRPQTHDEAIALIEAALNDVVASGTDVPSTTTTQHSAAPRVERPLSAPVVDPFALDASAAGAGVVTGAPTGVHGSLKQMNVVEIVQSLEPGRKTATVDVQSTAGERGTFACDAGRVVYAVTSTRVGEEAFYELVRHRAGVFRIHYGDAPPAQNITAQTQFLVLEALRRLDEGTGGLDAPTTQTSRATTSSPSAASPHTAPGMSGDGLPLVSAEGVPVAPIDAGAPIESIPSGEGAALVDAAFDARPTEQMVSPTAATVVRTVFASQPGARAEPTHVTSVAARSSALSPSEAHPAARGFEDDDDVVVPKAGSTATATTTTTTAAATTPTAPRVNGASRHDAAAAPVRAARGVDVDRRRRAMLGVGLGALGLLFIVVVVGVVVATSGGAVAGERALARIDDGDAADVLAELDEIPAEARTAEQHRVRGHALAALHAPSPPPDAALEEWLLAAKAKVVDARMLAGTLARLRADDAERALDVLAAWPRPEVVGRLRASLSDHDWTMRQHARMALAERGEFTDVDADALGVLDLSTAETCARRREALVMLSDRGFSAEAVIAIETARTRKDDNACLQRDLPLAAKAVAKRASAPRPAPR